MTKPGTPHLSTARGWRVHRSVLHALALLPLLAPVSLLAMSTGNSAPVVDGLTTSSQPASAGQTLTVSCVAHDEISVVRLVLTASDGVFANGGSSVDLALSDASTKASVSAPWTAPDVDNLEVTLTCTAWDAGGANDAPSRASATVSLVVSVQRVSAAPVVSALSASATSLFAGDSSDLSVTATDAGGGALTYVWSTSGGSLSGHSDADPSTVRWTALALPGAYTVSVDVSNAAGRTSRATLLLSSVWGKPSGQLSRAGLRDPLRVISDAKGRVHVSDHKSQVVWVFTPAGRLLRRIPVDGRPMGVAALDDGRLLVGESRDGRVLVLDEDGERVAMLGKGAGEVVTPADLTVDPLSGMIYVADAQQGAVKIYDMTSLARRDVVVLDDAGVPTGVAVAPAANRLYVADSRNSCVRVFDLDGRPVLGGSGMPLRIGAFGNGLGELRTLGGVVALGSDSLAVVDTYLARVTFFSSTGAVQATVGSWGAGAGQLKLPQGIALDAAGRLLVTSLDNQRIEIFDLAGSTPVLPLLDDGDMDGLVDSWEQSNGYDPDNPEDAYADSDGDGLSTLREYGAGTNPWSFDSDGDGVSDADELRNGYDPLDPEDQRPVADAGADLRSPPTLLLLDGTGSRGRLGSVLRYKWAFVDGPAAASLQGDDQAQPWAVLRTAGTYRFELSVSDGSQSSLPDQVLVEIGDVAPLAHVGLSQSLADGAIVMLDGRFSADANGDALHVQWTQAGGPPLLTTPSTQTVTLIPAAAPGRYRFGLGVRDARVSSFSSLWVAVHGPGDHVPVAAIEAPTSAVVGEELALDASASVDVDGQSLSFAWTQLDGPPVVTSGQSRLRFTPTEAGVYRFELVVSDTRHASVPVVTELAVDSATRHVPRTAGVDPERGQVLEELSLSCAGSVDDDGDLQSCAWTQVQGPPVALQTGASSARFVPLDAATYGFEVVASDSVGPGTTARVLVVVDDPQGNSVPAAGIDLQASTLDPGWTLSAVDSHDADGDSLGYAWTQLAGPPCRLADAHLASTAVAAPARTVTDAEGQPVLRPWPGTYRFALIVDDGKAVAPPVELEWVVPAPGVPGREQPGRPGPFPARVDGGSVVRLTETERPEPVADEVALPGEPVPAPAMGCTALPSRLGLGALMLLGLLARARRRRGANLALLTLAISSSALALDPPHDAVNLSNVCSECHIGHNAAGMGLTSNASNANLCLSCHQTKGITWGTDDQADPVNRAGTSHRWDAPVEQYDTEAGVYKFGTRAPSSTSEMGKRIVVGVIMCSTCHNEHGGTWRGDAAARLSAARIVDPPTGALSTGTLTPTGTFGGTSSLRYLVKIVTTGNQGSAVFQFSTDGSSWSTDRNAGSGVLLDNGVSVSFGAGTYQLNEVYSFTAAYPMLRPSATEATAGGWTDLSNMCVACHVERDATRTSEYFPPADSTDGTKVFSHPVGVLMNETGKSRAAPLDADGDAIQDGNHNDLKLVAGKVTCMTCHRVHGADSNAQTEDQP